MLLFILNLFWSELRKWKKNNPIEIFKTCIFQLIFHFLINLQTESVWSVIETIDRMYPLKLEQLNCFFAHNFDPVLERTTLFDTLLNYASHDCRQVL